MSVREVICKSALSTSSLPGLDYSLNPYRGCQHGCAYCYAPNVLRIPRAEWGCFVDVKTNVPVVLSQELKNKKRGVVGLSTVTDPYQPIESRYKLSRYCLEQLLIHDFPVFIQTKSALVLRDLDIIFRFSKPEIMFSIGTLKDDERKLLEPGASSIPDRLNALKKCSDEGIKTAVFFGPIYPTIKTDDLDQIIDAFKECGASSIMIDKLNLKPGVWQSVESRLKNNFSVLQIFSGNIFKTQEYYTKINEHIKKLGKVKKIEIIDAF